MCLRRVNSSIITYRGDTDQTVNLAGEVGPDPRAVWSSGSPGAEMRVDNCECLGYYRKRVAESDSNDRLGSRMMSMG